MTKDCLSSEITELQTDCESIWAEINITSTKKFIVGSYYRPPSDDGTSLEQLDISLNRIDNTLSAHLLLGRRL